MTNAAAIIGLTYDATDIQQNPIGIFLELVNYGSGPSVRGTDTIVPALAGRIARNRTADVWRLELRGLVAGIGATEALARDNFADLRATVIALFDPTASPAALVATLENGDTATIQARALPTILWDAKVPALAMVSIELEAVEGWVIT